MYCVKGDFTTQIHIDWRFVCGRMTQSEKAVIDQQEKTEAGASGNDLGAPFSLWAPTKGALTHHQPGAGGGTACGSRAPSGGGSAGVVLPCPVIPADANGGLCIGRSCADALGAWGPSATNKRVPGIYRRIACYYYHQ